MRIIGWVVPWLLVACGGTSTSTPSTTTDTSAGGGSGSVSIHWRVGVIDSASRDGPRYTELGEGAGEVAMTGTSWRCEVSETIRSATDSGSPIETRAVRCAYGSDYTAFAVTCAPDIVDQSSLSTLTLFEGADDHHTTVGLLCAYPMRSGPEPGRDIHWDLSVGTDAGETPLDLYVGEQQVPLPSSTGWACSMDGDDQPSDNGDQSVVVECRSQSQNVAIASLAGCYRAGTQSRFEMLHLGVGQNGQVGAEIKLSCDSLP